MDAFTHAGGVVVRREGEGLRFLLVTARNQSGEWVLPKGHIEDGESASEAAAREVLEEAGVTAVVTGEGGEALGELEYYSKHGRIRVTFFLMEFQAEGQTGERRDRAWLSADETRRRLRHEDARQLIGKADAKMRLW